jgi:hypothetical protein
MTNNSQICRLLQKLVPNCPPKAAESPPILRHQTLTSAKPWTFKMRSLPISLLTPRHVPSVFPRIGTGVARIGLNRKYSVHQRSFDEVVGDSPRRPKVTLANLRKMYMTNQKLAVMTAYDYPSGTFADRAGSDIVLVGDSLGMVCLGYESTNQVTLSVFSPTVSLIGHRT